MNNTVITIDGPAAAGKTTMAKQLANRFNFRYVDTGAFYRATAVALREKYGTVIPSEPGITDDIFIHAKHRQSHQIMYIGENRIPEETLRTPEIAQTASILSTRKDIRRFVDIAIREYADHNDIIIEGRDTGSVIFPNAEVKFYLTADRTIRAYRLYHMGTENETRKISEIEKDLKLRDTRDTSREIDPLVIPDKAIYIDNSYLTVSVCSNLMAGIIEHLV